MRRMNETADELDRWSSWKKMEAVLSLLKVENLDSLSQGLEVSAATLSPWRDVFLTNRVNGLKSQDRATAEGLGEIALNEVHIHR